MRMSRMMVEALVKRLMVFSVITLFMSAPSWATHDSRAFGSFDAQQSRDIEEIIHNYILSHPEVIAEAINKLDEQQRKAEEQKRQDAAKAVKPVATADHIRGNPAARVKVIEFSDFECPFCKRFHPTMKQLIDEYGRAGEVAIIYRHFPLDELHSKARKEAQAAECANELAGNDAFWAYADKIFEVTPSNDRLDLAMLPKIAVQLGLNGGKFEACLEGDMRGGKYASHIEANYQDALASGGTGTPYTLVVSGSGKIYPISGAMPYAAVKSIVDAALKEK